MNIDGDMNFLPPTAAYRATKVCASAVVGLTALSDAAQDVYESVLICKNLIYLLNSL
jgi:hypothetical protein